MMHGSPRRAAAPRRTWRSPAGAPPPALALPVGRAAAPPPYFGGIEPMLRSYDGRPHWGKLHTRTAEDLAPAYEHWADFGRVRDRVDPHRVFANAYLDRVLG